MFVIFYFLYLCCVYVNGVFYTSNFTDFSKCQVYYSLSGSSYKDFFDISENISDPSDNGTYILDFHFAVMAPSDAHILLAPSRDVKESDPAYEIVIGAGGNTFCDIRRRIKHEVKASVREKDLLSGLDPNFFWLHITKDGDISVGREGGNVSFISWTDPDVLPIKVFSFSTWAGIEAKWYFNCDRKNSAEEVEKRMTDVEKLRKKLLDGYDPYVRPVSDPSVQTAVSMALYLKHISIDEYKATIDIQGIVKLAWYDEKLQWNPEDFNGIESLHIFRREIWQPDLRLHNAIGDGSDILHDSMMVVDSTGIVQWTPALSMSAWCDAQEMGVWPRGTHRCGLLLSFARDHSGIRMEINESSQLYPDDLEWELVQLKMFMDDAGMEGQDLELLVFVRRRSRFYDTVFFTPFLVIAICQLSTFWVSPNGQMKIFLGCFQLVLCTIILVVLALIVPPHFDKVPYLVQLYSYSLLGSLISIIISILIINLVRVQRGPPSRCIRAMLTSRVCSISFCLSDLEADNYGKLETSEKINKFIWNQIGTIIDRIAFAVYLGLTIYAVVIGYI